MKDFFKKNEEFKEELEKVFKRAKLLDGKLHTTDTGDNRVSILYKGIGLYTYKLEERKILTEF